MGRERMEKGGDPDPPNLNSMVAPLLLSHSNTKWNATSHPHLINFSTAEKFAHIGAHCR